VRPYLAVIRDSFHEALVSRVLWILLAVITLLLLALLPLAFVEQAGSRLTDDDFLNRTKLLDKIVAAGRSDEPSPGKRIWTLLPEGVQHSMRVNPSDPVAVRMRFRGFQRALQDLLTRQDFYLPEDWSGVKLSPAGQSLERKGVSDLPSDQLARFNRLALEAAFPEEIAPAPPKQIQLGYFNWELGLPLPVEPEQLFPAMNQIVIIALSTLLGVAGVFVAVLVTASMIPQTFEPGSVDLLLSKPVSRSLLFLAKFMGGCVFIAINAAYLIGGLWLILGTRFGLWNSRLLWAIPLYLFLFAIYYAVSATAGVVWRNAIVSVVVAILFWFVCWLLGTADQLVDTLDLSPRRFTAVVPSGNDLLAVNSRGEFFRWDDADRDWQGIFAARDDNQMPFMFGGRMAGPVYDPKGERIVTFRAGMPTFSPLAAARRLLVGKRADEWRRTEGVNLPEGAYTLFAGPGEELLLAGSQGIYRLEGNLEARQQDINVFGLHIPLPDQGGRFVNVGPAVQMRPLQSAAIDPVSRRVALYDGHRLALFERPTQGPYRLAAEQSFPRKQSGKVVLAGDTLWLAVENEIRRYDIKLKPSETIAAPSRSAPELATASPDGRYVAIGYRDRTLWLYDVTSQVELGSSARGQGDISAMAFDGNDLLLVDRLTRVTRYQLPDLTVLDERQGAMPLVEKIYRWALHPLYRVFPKPGQLNDTVSYVLTSPDAPAGALRIDDNQNAPTRVDVWGPVWSNLAFLVVVMTLACVYISRKDF
jgi:hypothetical protein